MIEELLEKLTQENLKGSVKLDEGWIKWNITDNILLKIFVENQPGEGYIEAFYIKNGKEKSIAHWHTESDGIFDELTRINNGELVLIIKKTVFGERTMIISKEEFELKKDRYKANIFSKYYIVAL